MALGRRFLLVDARTVASAEGAEMRLGRAVKESHNPLFVADRAWEPRYDNLYANLAYDPQEGLYTCWYSPFIVDPGTRLVPPAERRRRPYPAEAMGPRQMGVCYAYSRDGLEWEKPPLALHLWEGGPSNIVARGPHGAGVFRDEREPDPARRYKMICREPAGMAARFSPDGLVWSAPTLLDGLVAEGDTHNNAFWAPTLGRYVCITRQWEHRLEGPVRGIRLVARSESEDFIHWSPATEICRGADDWQQLYAMPVWYHAGVYLGLPAVFDLRTDRVHTELCWSPDTLRWHRVQPGTPLLPPGARRGRYDWGCVYAAACPVFLPGEVRLYYGASDDTHMSWRRGGLALARLRADGFAGYLAEDPPGRVTTQPIPWNGGPIRVTADISRAGSVQVTALGAHGGVVARAAPLRRSVTDAALTWERPAAAGGQVVRLCFTLTRAQVFSFALAD